MLAESSAKRLPAIVGTGLAGRIRAIRSLAPEDNYHLHQLLLDWKCWLSTLAAALLPAIFGMAPRPKRLVKM